MRIVGLKNVGRVYTSRVYLAFGKRSQLGDVNTLVDVDVDRVRGDGDAIRMGDRIFEVIHAPGHSSDSMGLYNADQGVLLAGDSSLPMGPAGSYEARSRRTLNKSSARDVRRIYFGHGPPLTERCNERRRQSQQLVASSAPASEEHEPTTSQLPEAAK